MKHFVITLAFVALGFPVVVEAEEEIHLNFTGPYVGQLLPVVSEEDNQDFNVGVFGFGVWQNGADSISSKFMEYRDIPQGAVSPFFRLQGKKGDYRYDLFGHDVTQQDQRYFGRFEGEAWRVDVDYTGIPHVFGNGGRSILIPAARVDDTEWRISDSLQESFQSQVEALSSRSYENLRDIVQPTLDTQPTTIDVKLQRDRTNVAFSLTPPESNFEVGVTYFHERRTGARTNNGTSFGFGNVIETTDPIKYITQDFGVNATTRGDWGIAFAGVHINEFKDRFDTFGWDNPFRATDSTDPSAYTAPGRSSINGSKTGLLALPPDNEAWTINGGTTLFAGSRTRFTADLQVGQWKQNEDPFIGYTVNTAIVTPEGELAVDAPLPATTLNGKIDVLALNGFLTSKVSDRVRLNARYRFYRNDNKTPRLRFEEGYVRFDAVWEEIPRISVPYGWDSNYFDVYGTFDAGKILGFEVGYKWNRISREFRETDNTTENTARAAANLRFEGGVLIRGLYEFGSRDFDRYDPIAGEEPSYLEPEDPANQTVLRRFDQAKRDRNRVGVQLQFTPDSGTFSVGAGYFLNKDDYDDGLVPCIVESEFCSGGQSRTLGLLEAEYKTFSLDFDVTPNDRTTVYAFYSREDLFNYQTGRQSSSSTLVFDPATNWSSTQDDKVDSVGVGANFTLVPVKWFLDLFYRYQKVDGNNAFTAGSALRPSGAEDIPLYDDTELHFASAQVRYKFATSWTLGVGGFYENYKLKDTQTGQVLNYMPGSFFLNPNNGDYGGWVGWLNLSYAF